MTFELRGEFDFGQVKKAMHDAAVVGLEMGLDHVLQVSQTLVPNEEGTLERSGRVVIDEANLTGGVTYDTEYARRQHEELTWRHSNGRTAKYLERALTSEGATVADYVAAAQRRALR